MLDNSLATCVFPHALLEKDVLKRRTQVHHVFPRIRKVVLQNLTHSLHAAFSILINISRRSKSTFSDTHTQPSSEAPSIEYHMEATGAHVPVRSKRGASTNKQEQIRYLLHHTTTDFLNFFILCDSCHHWAYFFMRQLFAAVTCCARVFPFADIVRPRDRVVAIRTLDVTIDEFTRLAKLQSANDNITLNVLLSQRCLRTRFGTIICFSSTQSHLNM